MFTLRLRLIPTKTQKRRLELFLDECRWTYNQVLETRKNAWEQEKKSLSCFDTMNLLPSWKVEKRPQLTEVYAQVLQNVCVRVDLAFKAFFRRVKAGEKPGYPRFQGRNRYDSFTYSQWIAGFSLSETHIKLPKIGSVKIRGHKEFTGKIKTATVKRSSTGKWYVTLTIDQPLQSPQQAPEPAIGLDLGLLSFVTTSDGEKTEAPKFFRKEEKALAKAQRALAKHEKGTPARAKARKVVARVHERIRNRRSNFTHKLSRILVNRYNFIAVEDLEVNRMVQDHRFAKSIQDAAWSEFLSKLEYKAAWAGRQVIRVNPAYTSQTCHSCGARQKLQLSDRTYTCPCGWTCDRDVNAAKNILKLARLAESDSGITEFGANLEASTQQ